MLQCHFNSSRLTAWFSAPPLISFINNDSQGFHNSSPANRSAYSANRLKKAYRKKTGSLVLPLSLSICHPPHYRGIDSNYAKTSFSSRLPVLSSPLLSFPFTLHLLPHTPHRPPPSHSSPPFSLTLLTALLPVSPLHPLPHLPSSCPSAFDVLLPSVTFSLLSSSAFLSSLPFFPTPLSLSVYPPHPYSTLVD